jgi:hypothetical protein
MHGFCVSCERPISFNPELVPSLRVNGEREPVCRGCFKLWNEVHRVSKGLEPVKLRPGAYEPERVCPDELDVY